MLGHLVDFKPEIVDTADAVPVDKAAPANLLDAQYATAQWLEAMGAPTTQTLIPEAQDAFAAMVQNSPAEQQRAKLMKVTAPAAVKHLVGMLTAYDWTFVEQAKELRGYAVAQLVEETKHPDAKIRLRALELLGKVTEIGLFTERVEIKKTEMSEKDLDERIKDKLNRFMGVVDATPIDAIPIEAQRIDAAP